MLKSVISKRLVLGLFLGLPVLAQATPMQYVDTVDPDDVLLNAADPTHTYIHNINDDGYDPLLDTLLSAELVIDVRDDVRGELPPPVDPPIDPLVIFLDSILQPGIFEVDFADITLGVDVNLIAPDGLLSVTLFMPLQGPEFDLVFRASTLTVEADRANDVPAPATLALFGLGLAGLGWSRRKKA